MHRRSNSPSANLAVALIAAAFGLCCFLPRVGSPGVFAEVISRNNGNNRTSFYPNAKIDAADVTSGNWGPAFVTVLPDGANDSVTAQPLVYTPASSTRPVLIVVTDNTNVYIMDALNGTILNSKNYGPPAYINIWGYWTFYPGIMSTPVIDSSTDTLYFTTLTSTGNNTDIFHLYAVDVMSLETKDNYPILFANQTADNDRTLSFNDYRHKQRVGLSMVQGAIIVMFAGYDKKPCEGWVFVVEATTGTIKSVFSASTSTDVTEYGGGGGIWMSGFAPVVLDNGTIFFSTGNGYGNELNDSTSGYDAASLKSYYEAIVRLDIASDLSMSIVDFFIPFNASQMDEADTDASADGVILLPELFGNETFPNILLIGAKTGPFKFVPMNNLGGFKQGYNGTDATIVEFDYLSHNPSTIGTWGSISVMPLDSGWIYLMGAQGALQAWKKSQTTDGSIDFEFAGISTEYTRGGSSPPQVTLPNDGVTDSSAALLWILMGEPLPESSEWFFKDMLEVAAYKAVPDSDGVLQKVWSYPATSRHFSSPGVGNNGFIYVATLEGYVYGFGSGSNYSAPENWNYVGCYTDNGTQPVLGTQHGTDYYTVDQCTAAALSAGYSYAGLRAGGLCFFGSALQSAQSTSLTNCDLPCTAATSSGQVCGGNTTISVFSTTASGSNSPTNGSSSGSSSKLSTGAIAGIAVAAVVVAAALIVGAVVLVRNRAHKAGEFDADDAAAAGAASSSAGAAAGAGGSRDLDPPILLTALGGERGAFDNSSQSSQIRLPAAGVTPAGAQQ